MLQGSILITKKRYINNPDDNFNPNKPIDEEPEDSKEKPNYKKPTDWKVYYINKSGNQILFQPHKVNNFSKSNLVYVNNL